MKKVVLQAKRTLSLVLAGLMVLTAVPQAAKTVNAEEIVVVDDVITDDAAVVETINDVIVEEDSSADVETIGIVDDGTEENADTENTGERNVVVSMNSARKYAVNFDVLSIKVNESDEVATPETGAATTKDEHVKAVKDYTIQATVKYNPVVIDSDSDDVADTDSYMIPEVQIDTAKSDIDTDVDIKLNKDSSDLENGVAVYDVKFTRSLTTSDQVLALKIVATNKPIYLTVNADANVLGWKITDNQTPVADTAVKTDAVDKDQVADDVLYLHVYAKKNLAGGKKVMIDKVKIGDFDLIEESTITDDPQVERIYRIATAYDKDEETFANVVKDETISVTTAEFVKVSVSVNNVSANGLALVGIGESKWDGEELGAQFTTSEKDFFVAKGTSHKISFKYNTKAKVDVSVNAVKVATDDNKTGAIEASLSNITEDTKVVINPTEDAEQHYVYFVMEKRAAQYFKVDGKAIDFVDATRQDNATVSGDSLSGTETWVIAKTTAKHNSTLTPGFNNSSDNIVKFKASASVNGTAYISDLNDKSVDINVGPSDPFVSSNDVNTSINVKDDVVYVLFCESNAAKLVVSGNDARGIEKILYSDDKVTNKEFVKETLKEKFTKNTLIKEDVEYSYYQYENGDIKYAIVDGKYVKEGYDVNHKVVYLDKNMEETTDVSKAVAASDDMAAFQFVAYTVSGNGTNGVIDNVTVKLKEGYTADDVISANSADVDIEKYDDTANLVYKVTGIDLGKENLISLTTTSKHKVEITTPTDGSVTNVQVGVNGEEYKDYTDALFIDDNAKVSVNFVNDSLRYRAYVDSVDGANYIPAVTIEQEHKYEIKHSTTATDQSFDKLLSRKADYAVTFVTDKLTVVNTDNLFVDDDAETGGLNTGIDSVKIYSMGLPKEMMGGDYIDDQIHRASENVLMLGAGDVVIIKRAADQQDVVKNILVDGTKIIKGYTFVHHSVDDADDIFKCKKNTYWYHGDDCTHTDYKDTDAEYFVVGSGSTTLKVESEVNADMNASFVFKADGEYAYTVKDIINNQTSESIMFSGTNKGDYQLKNGEWFEFKPVFKYDDIKVSACEIVISKNDVAVTAGDVKREIVVVSANDDAAYLRISANGAYDEKNVEVKIVPHVETTPVYFYYNNKAVELEVKDNGTKLPIKVSASTVPSFPSSKTNGNKLYFVNAVDGAELDVVVKPATDYSKLKVSINEFDLSDENTWPDDPEVINITEAGGAFKTSADKAKVFVFGEELSDYVEVTEYLDATTPKGDAADITSVSSLAFDYATVYKINAKVDSETEKVRISDVKIELADGTTVGTESSDLTNGEFRIKFNKANAGKTGTLSFTTTYNNGEPKAYSYSFTIAEELKAIDFSPVGLVDKKLVQEAATTKEYTLVTDPVGAGVGGVKFVAKSSTDSANVTIVGPDKDGKIEVTTKAKAATASDITTTWYVQKDGETIDTIKIVITTPVLPTPVVKVTPGYKEIAVDADTDALDDSTGADYQVVYFYKKSTEATFKAWNEAAPAEVTKDAYGDWNVDADTIYGLDNAKAYDIKARLSKISNNSVVATAESAVVSTATKEEAIEYKLNIKEVQKNVYAGTPIVAAGVVDHYQSRNTKVATAVFNDNITDIAIDNIKVYNAATGAEISMTNLDSPIHVETVGNDIFVEAINCKDVEYDNPYFYDAKDFCEYKIVVTADTTFAETADRTRRVEAATAEFVVNVVKSGEPTSTGYPYNRYVKTKGVALEIPAPTIKYEGVNVSGRFKLANGNSANVKKYVTVDKATGALSIDAALEIERFDVIDVDFEPADDRDVPINGVSVTLAAKSVAEQVAWIAVASLDAKTGYTVVDPTKLEVNSVYYVIAGDANAAAPEVGMKYATDAVVDGLVATSASPKYAVAAGGNAFETKAIGGKKATIKIATADGSVLPKKLAKTTVKTVYQKLEGATVAYAYENDQVKSEIAAGKTVTDNFGTTDAITLKVVPTTGETESMNLSVKVSNAKTVAKYNSVTGEVKVIVKNIKKPIVVKIKDKATKKSKTLTFKLKSNSSETKAKKKVTGVKQNTKAKVYSGTYAQQQEIEFTVKTKSYAGKTIVFTPDFQALAKDKKGDYAKFINAVFAEGNDGAALGYADRFAYGDVDATTKTVTIKTVANADVPAGTYKMYAMVRDENNVALTKATSIKVKITKSNAKAGTVGFASNVTMTTSGTEFERAHVTFTGEYNYAKVLDLYCVNNNGKVNNFTKYFNVANEAGGFYIYVENGWLDQIKAEDLTGLVKVEYSAGKDALGNNLPAKTVLLPITISVTK